MVLSGDGLEEEVLKALLERLNPEDYLGRRLSFQQFDLDVLRAIGEALALLDLDFTGTKKGRLPVDAAVLLLHLQVDQVLQLLGVVGHADLEGEAVVVGLVRHEGEESIVFAEVRQDGAVADGVGDELAVLPHEFGGTGADGV